VRAARVHSACRADGQEYAGLPGSSASAQFFKTVLQSHLSRALYPGSSIVSRTVERERKAQGCRAARSWGARGGRASTVSASYRLDTVACSDGDLLLLATEASVPAIPAIV
jgi:hypothetical protein